MKSSGRRCRFSSLGLLSSTSVGLELFESLFTYRKPLDPVLRFLGSAYLHKYPVGIQLEVGRVLRDEIPPGS